MPADPVIEFVYATSSEHASEKKTLDSSATNYNETDSHPRMNSTPRPDGNRTGITRPSHVELHLDSPQGFYLMPHKVQDKQ